MTKSPLRSPAEAERRRVIREAVQAAGSVSELARQHGMPLGVLYTRLFRLSWDLERALSEPRMSTRQRAVKRHGLDVRVEAEKRGLSYFTVRDRMRRGLTAAQALEGPAERKPCVGPYGCSVRAEALRRGLAVPTVYWRLRAGWALDDALETPVNEHYRRVWRQS